MAAGGAVVDLAYLSSVAGAQALAGVAAAPPPHTCRVGVWTLGEVRGVLQRLQVCCGAIHDETFLRLADGSGWFIDDEVALGDALRIRAAELCSAAGDGAAFSISAVGDGAAETRCGKEKHMYQHGDVSGTRDVARDADCVTERHVAAYGATGLPSRPLEPARVGHLQPLGHQGQPRRAVTEVLGCDDELMWAHAYRNQPLVMRGCVGDRSPRTLHWTAAHLREVAGDHSSRYCQEPFGEYLARMNTTDRRQLFEYRNCGELPSQMLGDVAVPYPLAHAPYRRGFDKVVLWYGRSNISPLHFDPNHNYMHQLDGQKRLLLVDPADSALLYADHASSAVGNTPVNPFRVDMDAHPLASLVSLWPVVLHRGDVLFIPSQWWHMVVTLPAVGDALDAADVRNMALTCQFDRSVRPSIFSHFSRQRAELYLNIPQRVPTTEELAREEQRNRRGEAAVVAPKSMADLRGSEWTAQ